MRGSAPNHQLPSSSIAARCPKALANGTTPNPGRAHIQAQIEQPRTSRRTATGNPEWLPNNLNASYTRL